MEQLGYEGDLLQRQDDYGLAMFWRSSTFQLVAHRHTTLHHLAETHLQVSSFVRRLFEYGQTPKPRAPIAEFAAKFFSAENPPKIG